MKKTILLLSGILILAVLLCPPAAAYELCEVHGFDYHAYDGELIRYVGNDVFMTWLRENGSGPGQDGCLSSGNIYRFLHELDIPRAVFEECLYSWSFWQTDYPADLLYEADAEAADAYYRDYASREEYLEKKMSHLSIRLDLLELAEETEAYRPFCGKYVVDGRIRPFSVADFVRVTGIPKEALRAFMESKRIVEYPAHTMERSCFEWDFDLLYEIASEPEKSTPLGKINEDLRFCGQPEIAEGTEKAPQTRDRHISWTAVLTAAGSSTCIFLIRRKRRT